MAGFENCIDCHGTILAGMPYVNLTSLNNSMHGRVNNVNDLNYACYACHWDGTPPKIHPIDLSLVKMCSDCHVSNLFNAPLVSEHIQNGKDINISTSCTTCHSNSVDTNASYFNIFDRVSHYGTTNNLIQSKDCAFCHYNNSGNSIWGAPNDPRISFVALNHTPFTASTECYGCHVRGGGTPPTFHDSTMGLGGNKNCISCHDIGGAAPYHVNFSAANDDKAVHRTLNANAITSLNSNNLRCWACHGDGDGSENAQPAGGHPLNYKTPKNCNNNDCHSLSQSPYQEPMVYSHFQNASLNGNQNNATNYNITTSVQCQICHLNSLVITDNNTDLALTSHYASTDNLIDSFKCTYCHLVKNNSEAWGNATLIYKNTTSLIELEKERNKLTAFEGESVYLGNGYSLKVVEISSERSEALIQLLKNYSIVDEFSIGVGSQYNYEEYTTIDNGTFKMPIIILNITSIFKGANQSLIQFSGFRTARVHAETNSTACFACHLYRYSPEKQRYLVIDRDLEENPNNDIIYFTNVFVDFISENKSKIYYNGDDYVLNQINTDFGTFLPSPSLQKYLKVGETWNLGENISLKLNDVSTDSKQALLALMINNSVVEDWAVTSGSEFSYTRPIRYKGYQDINVTIFSANLTSVVQANPNFVILKDVLAISPSIMKTTANTTAFGYNSSWLFPNDTFIVGKVPENLHIPNLYTDQRMWADCVNCHDTSRKLNIPNFDAVSSRLGKHDRLNGNASIDTLLSDSIDKACWACHTLDSQEPQSHVPTYTTPRSCKSCHIYQENPNFGAINISDEPHALEQNCESCHILQSHNLKRFLVSPVIREAALDNIEAVKGEKLKLTARAMAGYKMKIRAAEYFMDRMGTSGNGTPLGLINGTYDSQVEDVTAEINTTNISVGAHVIYIHAMERNNNWGEFYPVNFTITEKSMVSDIKKVIHNVLGSVILALITGLTAAYLFYSKPLWRLYSISKLVRK
ncbi:MAG: S-layer protein domain-containing protein [Candidatus Methanoperedens sp.]|nr:S-layer protein domain-containing protein [Candidatus Methanoperedens sp.]MCZ7370682.1 S-layer protein domain-containing protein [Candidatus Methanoperedens sp.]